MITIRTIIPFIAVLCVSCTNRNAEADANNNALVDGDVGSTNQAMFRPATLPQAGGGGDPCDEPPNEPKAPSVCEWANSFDAIVFGTLDAVRPLTSPVWVYDGPNDPYLADECDGAFMNIGVKFELSVTDVLYGDMAEDEIVVHVGMWGREHWGVQPILTQDDEFAWQGGEILEVGTTVGMAITRVPDADVWSLMGDLPFTFEADGSSRFVGNGLCYLILPEPMPADYTTLQQELDGCEVATNELHQQRLNLYTQNPAYSHVVACHH